MLGQDLPTTAPWQTHMICQCASDSGVRTLKIGLVFLVFALYGGPSAIVTNSLGTLFPEFYLHDDEIY